MGMTAHIVLDAIDPDRPATTSPEAIRVIREEIGFDGLLMTDDVGMEALSGPIRDRAARSIARRRGHRRSSATASGPTWRRAVAGAGRLTGAAAGPRRPARWRCAATPEPADIQALVEELRGPRARDRPDGRATPSSSTWAASRGRSTSS